MFQQSFDSPVGRLMIRSNGLEITEISFLHESSGLDGLALPDALTELAASQLEEYFSGKRKEFDLPLKISGTAFQQAVYRALIQVPFGQTTTYGLLAAQAGYPGAARAVGTAMRNNRLVIVVPCHRVLAAGGLGGYSCGLEIKRRLLRLEGIAFTE